MADSAAEAIGRGAGLVGDRMGGSHDSIPQSAGPLASGLALPLDDTARNLIVTKYRSDGRHRRHIHRLVEYNSIGDPEELALRREENDALADRAGRVPENDRELLLFHEVDGVDTATLAAHSDSTPGGIAMRLAHARALLRLEFVLALRGVELTNAAVPGRAPRDLGRRHEDARRASTPPSTSPTAHTVPR